MKAGTALVLIFLIALVIFSVYMEDGLGYRVCWLPIIRERIFGWPPAC